MSKITPKSPEVIQAQVAAFAAEHVEHRSDREHIFNNLASVSVGNSTEISRITTSYEYREDEEGNDIRIPEGTEVPVANISEYRKFLQLVGGSQYEAIQSRAEMLKKYGRFESTITTLREELADPTKRREHPNFLGSGSNAMVFSITEGDKTYAVRVPKGNDIDPLVIDSHVAGAVLGRGIPHLEQIVAASYKDGVTVAEIMPGKVLKQLTLVDVQSITDDQISELVDTLITANKRGIKIDPKLSNIFYDPIEGYGFVDYLSSKVAGKDSTDQDLGTVISRMAIGLDNAGFSGKSHNFDKTEKDYATDLELIKTNLEVLERYRNVVEAKLSGEDQQKAVAKIDELIASSNEAVDTYLNPEWVAEQIAKQQERKRQQAERAKNPSTEGSITLDTV